MVVSFLNMCKIHVFSSDEEKILYSDIRLETTEVHFAETMLLTSHEKRNVCSVYLNRGPV